MRIKKYFWLYLAIICLFSLSSCRNKNSFALNGHISNWSDTTQVYILKILGNDLSVLDSVTPDKNGAFSIQIEGDSTLSFYQLRFGKQIINFAAQIGSEIGIQADAKNFGTAYSIEEKGEEHNEDIQKIALLKYQTDQTIDQISRSLQEKRISAVQFQDTVRTVIETFKTTLRNDYIFRDPKSPASFFALFQQKDGLLYFNVYDPTDVKAFAAVATAYETYYPSSPYTKGIRDISLLGLAAIRREKKARDISSKAEERTIPDLTLIDRNGTPRPLSEVVKENSKVLISFTSYEAEWSPELVKDLRSLYKKYHGTGFEIYEISVDKNTYFWQNAARTLPWITVIDRDGMAPALFNISSLPSFFIFQDGELKRLHSISKL